MEMFLYLFLFGTTCASAEMFIRIGIIDDYDHSQKSFNIDLPNLNMCDQHGIQLQLSWINSSGSSSNLLDRLERQENFTHVYLARQVKFSSKSIQDFCQTNRIPFVTLSSLSQRMTTYV